jgi:hypothetical protein
MRGENFQAFKYTINSGTRNLRFTLELKVHRRLVYFQLSEACNQTEYLLDISIHSSTRSENTALHYVCPRPKVEHRNVLQWCWNGHMSP